MLPGDTLGFLDNNGQAAATRTERAETMETVQLNSKFQDTRTGEVMEITAIACYPDDGNNDTFTYRWLSGNHQPVEGWQMTRERLNEEISDGILAKQD